MTDFERLSDDEIKMLYVKNLKRFDKGFVWLKNSEMTRAEMEKSKEFEVWKKIIYNLTYLEAVMIKRNIEYGDIINGSM